MTDTDALSVEVEMERDEAPGHVVAIGASAGGSSRSSCCSTGLPPGPVRRSS